MMTSLFHRQFQLTCTFLFFTLSLTITAQEVNFDALQYRCVGPNRGGRATTVAGVTSIPGTFYMGATGGGVWKTEDYGTTWKNISDGYFKSPSIGAIRVAPNNPSIVYVGTGSDGLRSNVIAGNGMYKSKDAGKTWKHIGLPESGHIGAVEVHPTNPEVAFVAAIGQAFSANEERGVFRTTNGGNTWDKVLYLSDTTGFADLEFHPQNPKILYATAWRAERKPWTIISGGKENGIYKSTDGGSNWKKVDQGLPALKGKIDLAVSPANPSILYALVEAPGKESGLYKSIDEGETYTQVSDNFALLARAFYYTNLDADPQNADIVYANGLRLLKSTNGGKDWKSIPTPHGDNHDMWINPNNPDLFVQSNDGGANVTHNGGKTWSTQYNQPTAELYQIEVDDQYPYWLYAGQQDNYTTVSVPSMPPKSHQISGMGYVMDTGGCETGPAVPKPGDANIVYSNCKGRFGVFNKLTGQERHYDVGAANMYGQNPKDLRFRFQRVSPIHVSPHDADVIYHCSQFVHKTTDEGKTWEIISPDLTAFDPSKQVISGGPITRDITGEEFYSTIYSIRESKLEAGVIWVGANDGPVHVTRNAGKDWAKVTPESLPEGGRVDCVEPSPHNPAKAYIAVLRYQLGDWKPYIYKTSNYGESWQLLTTGKNGIAEGFPTRVVREDPNQEGLLYAGTEYGMFVSFDDGQNWSTFQQNLPVTPITDIKVHREDLVLSTMGRSFWVLDNISTLRQALVERKSNTLFEPKPAHRYRYYPSKRVDPITKFPNYPRPAMVIDYYIPEGVKDTISLEIYNKAGDLVRSFDGKQRKQEDSEVRDMSTEQIFSTSTTNLNRNKGLHRLHWDLKHTGAWDEAAGRRYQNGPLVAPGTYTIHLKIDGQSYKQSAEVLADPKVIANGTTLTNLEAQEKLSLEIRDAISEAKKLAVKIQEELKTTPENPQLKELATKLVQSKGRYTEPKLISQLQYLFGILNRADQIPGKDAYDRFDQLKKEYQEIENIYSSLPGTR